MSPFNCYIPLKYDFFNESYDIHRAKQPKTEVNKIRAALEIG